MNLMSKSMLCSALCAVTLVAAASPISAAEVGGLVRPFDPAVTSSGLLSQVQYRGYNGYSRNRHRGNGGRNLALGIGGLIVGGILLSEAARSEHRVEHSSDWQRCAQTYRSFEPDTGLFTGYDGLRHPCPFLR